MSGRWVCWKAFGNQMVFVPDKAVHMASDSSHPGSDVASDSSHSSSVATVHMASDSSHSSSVATVHMASDSSHSSSDQGMVLRINR
jgi:hypothetical protein